MTLRQLLDEFWARHDPTSLNRQGNDSGTQYRAGIYTHDPEQLEEAARHACGGGGLESGREEGRRLPSL